MKFIMTALLVVVANVAFGATENIFIDEDFTSNKPDETNVWKNGITGLEYVNNTGMIAKDKQALGRMSAPLESLTATNNVTFALTFNLGDDGKSVRSASIFVTTEAGVLSVQFLCFKERGADGKWKAILSYGLNDDISVKEIDADDLAYGVDSLTLKLNIISDSSANYSLLENSNAILNNVAIEGTHTFGELSNVTLAMESGYDAENTKLEKFSVISTN